MSNQTWEKRIAISEDEPVNPDDDVFKDRKGYYQLEQIDPVRWVWGVRYKPTAEQLKEAEKETTKKKAELREELERVSNLPDEKHPDKRSQMSAIKKEMGRPVEPVQNEMRQYEADGTFHSIKDVDVDRVDQFIMHRWDSIEDRIIMPVTDAVKLFHSYENFHDQRWDNFNTTARIFHFGFQYRESKDEAHCFILPDDTPLFSPHYNVDFTRYNITDPDHA